MADALGSDCKGKLSPVLYAVGDPAGVRQPLDRRSRSTSWSALMWLVPDRRIERRLNT